MLSSGSRQPTILKKRENKVIIKNTLASEFEFDRQISDKPWEQYAREERHTAAYNPASDNMSTSPISLPLENGCATSSNCNDNVSISSISSGNTDLFSEYTLNMRRLARERNQLQEETLRRIRQLEDEMLEQGVRVWKDWCASKKFYDQDRVTPQKMIEYMDYVVQSRGLSEGNTNTDPALDVLLRPVLEFWKKQDVAEVTDPPALSLPISATHLSSAESTSTRMFLSSVAVPHRLLHIPNTQSEIRQQQQHASYEQEAGLATEGLESGSEELHRHSQQSQNPEGTKAILTSELDKVNLQGRCHGGARLEPKFSSESEHTRHLEARFEEMQQMFERLEDKLYGQGRRRRGKRRVRKPHRHTHKEKYGSSQEHDQWHPHRNLEQPEEEEEYSSDEFDPTQLSFEHRKDGVNDNHTDMDSQLLSGNPPPEHLRAELQQVERRQGVRGRPRKIRELSETEQPQEEHVIKLREIDPQNNEILNKTQRPLVGSITSQDKLSSLPQAEATKRRKLSSSLDQNAVNSEIEPYDNSQERPQAAVNHNAKEQSMPTQEADPICMHASDEGVQRTFQTPDEGTTLLRRSTRIRIPRELGITHTNTATLSSIRRALILGTALESTATGLGSSTSAQSESFRARSKPDSLKRWRVTLPTFYKKKAEAIAFAKGGGSSGSGISTGKTKIHSRGRPKLIKPFSEWGIPQRTLKDLKVVELQNSERRIFRRKLVMLWEPNLFIKKDFSKMTARELWLEWTYNSWGWKHCRCPTPRIWKQIEEAMSSASRDRVVVKDDHVESKGLDVEASNSDTKLPIPNIDNTQCEHVTVDDFYPTEEHYCHVSATAYNSVMSHLPIIIRHVERQGTITLDDALQALEEIRTKGLLEIVQALTNKVQSPG
ncbi:hypothetical protein BX616_004765 [Lobosporangium transversale]|uniref:Uncharacterized protein n=1 Tax=Lobosporangium transversale TaxID=64571 RepID=A0A1Y2GBE1_9FUNG|nr:hypothetical protein BCR41DRAFT_361032 [Lobosporangium transversale]KAF9916034.1 hypothetical protein BX616_004765 [Lobosporangium transversale]ORZ06294.1 hypothetical protein BCR41DRAFT_361032 [Lobosporangium transversale]|eukprot:XP_021877457.1 hypothetical protein BCR41DRAFT_361032 [Lobosporangium transversale]